MKSWLSTKKAEDWALALILVIAFLFRFIYLGLKPPHFDEGINGWFVDQLINNGFYSYDPTNYHGPFHFYVIWVFKFIFGRNLWGLRFSASLFGFASVYLMARLRTYLGTATAFIGTFFVALSPGMVFYSRYGIHESELLFFSLIALHGFLRFSRIKDKTSLWFMGLGVTGMIVTKETFILHLACFGMAYACLFFYEKVVPSTLFIQGAEAGGRTPPPPVNPITQKDVFLVVSSCIFIFYLFYSGFLLHTQGVLDFFKSFAAWSGTAQKGNGHEKPFWYWLQLFWHYEIFGLVGLFLTIRLLLPSPKWIRLIGIYGVGILLAYSIISYKTPWCILNIVWPFYLVTASVLSELARRFKHKGAFLVFVVALGIPLAYESTQINFYKYDDESEPYVYVQTFTDIMKIDEKVMDVVKKDPSLYHMSIKLFMGSNWPIPWLFGDFTKVAYYGAYNDNDPNGALILCDEKWSALVESKLNKPYYKVNFRLRSAQEPAVAYFETDVFKDEFAADAPCTQVKAESPILPGEGLLAEYYENAEWTGKPVMKKVLSDPTFSFQDSQRPLPAPFGIIFSGEIKIPTSGEKVFYLDSDDGSDLSIDGMTVIENLGRHPEQMRSGTKVLKAGWHTLRIRYNDFGGGMVLRLWWNNDSGFQQSIDPKFFRISKKGGGHP